MTTHNCPYCGKEFNSPVTSGHKRKCDAFLASKAKEDRIPPPCACGHVSTSLTQMKRHRRDCIQWAERDKTTIAQDRQKATYKRRYGDDVTNPIHIPAARAKAAKTNKERYGAENVFSRESSLFEQVQSVWDGKDRTAHLPKDNFAKPEIKEKIKQYYLDHHGVTNSSQVPEIRAKQLATNLKRYGDEQTLRVASIREKGVQTLLRDYGVSDAMKLEATKRKVRETNLARYGVEWTTLGESREKQYRTQILKYGAKFFSSDIGRAKVRQALYESENVPKDGIRKRALKLNKLEQTIESCNSRIVFTGNGSFFRRLPDLGIAKNPDFIVPGPDPEHPYRNVRKVIEALGIYWHGFSVVGLHQWEYEALLIQAYKNIGISCLVVWEDETWQDPAALKAKIDAFVDSEELEQVVQIQDFEFKNVSIHEESSLEVFAFLNEHHYGGFGRSASRVYVCEHDGQILAVAKFAPPSRQNIVGSTGTMDVPSLELDRFCIHPDAHKKNFATYFMSRILKLLKRDRKDIKQVISYADPSQGHAGTIYKASNWTQVGKTSHSYYYLCPDGSKINKKTLFNKARSTGFNEREYAERIGAERVSTPPKHKFIYLF